MGSMRTLFFFTGLPATSDTEMQSSQPQPLFAKMLSKRYRTAFLSSEHQLANVPRLIRTYFNLAETCQHFASSAVHGEHLWLGSIYTNMIKHFREHGLNFPLTTLTVGAQDHHAARSHCLVMWYIKETCRGETLLGLTTDLERVRARISRHRSDIRS